MDDLSTSQSIWGSIPPPPLFLHPQLIWISLGLQHLRDSRRIRIDLGRRLRHRRPPDRVDGVDLALHEHPLRLSTSSNFEFRSDFLFCIVGWHQYRTVLCLAEFYFSISVTCRGALLNNLCGFGSRVSQFLTVLSKFPPPSRSKA